MERDEVVTGQRQRIGRLADGIPAAVVHCGKRRLADAIDWDATYLNALTAAHPAGARLPVVCDNDRDAIRHALNAAGVEDAAHARVVRIADTLHVETFAASEAALAAMRDGGRYAVGEASDALTLAGDDLAPFHGSAALA